MNGTIYDDYERRFEETSLEGLIRFAFYGDEYSKNNLHNYMVTKSREELRKRLKEHECRTIKK